LEELDVLLGGTINFLLVNFICQEIDSLHVEWDEGKRNSTVVNFAQLLEVDHHLILGREEFFVFLEDQLAYYDIYSVVSLFEGIHSVSDDRILLYSLKCICLLEGQVSWPRQLISQQVVVDLDLSVMLEVFSLS
jgi:hypothetical protein